MLIVEMCTSLNTVTNNLKNVALVSSLALLSACGDGAGDVGNFDMPDVGAANPVNVDTNNFDIVGAPVDLNTVADFSLKPSNDAVLFIRAINQFGSSEWSEPLAITFPFFDDNNVLDPVTGLVQRESVIEWSRNSDALGYEIMAANGKTGEILGESTDSADLLCGLESCRVVPSVVSSDSPSSDLQVSINSLVNEGGAPYFLELQSIISGGDLTSSYDINWSVPGFYIGEKNEPNFDYVFNSAGEYRIKLEVTDGADNTYTDYAYVRVFAETNEESYGVDSTFFETNFATGELLEISAALPTNEPTSEQEAGIVAAPVSPSAYLAVPIPVGVDDSVQNNVGSLDPDSGSTDVALFSLQSLEAEPSILPLDIIEPQIINIKISDVTNNSAIITWTMSELSTGQVEFGTTQALGSTSNFESSFNYSTHIQQLTSLQGDTEYFFRVLSSDEYGNEAVSDISSFVTKPTPVNTVESSQSADWPSNADSRLPLAGIFYGNAASGVGAQNARISVESSRRFRAERSGFVEYVRYQNRTLNMNNITSRCEASGPGSTWCNCVDAGLDEYTCGYTLGSSYHVGNGGTLVVEMRTADEDGLPTDVVLGKTRPFVPMENAKTPYPALQFESPVQIEEGALYHLVFTNSTPPTNCAALVNISPNDARNCPRNQGAQGLNGIRFLSSPPDTGIFGPYYGDESAANFYRASANSGWRFYRNALSWYELGYADDVKVGFTYLTLESISNGKHTINGNLQARQKFTVEDASRVVDGVWLNYGHTRSADGSPLSVRLKNDNGTTLASGSIAASSYCIKTVKEDIENLAHWCQDWGYTTFNQAVNLQVGATYTVEFSAGSKAGFLLSAHRTLNDYGFDDRNEWDNSVAELSKNGGSSWGDWTTSRPQERDLSVLFTIEGMPRKLK